jgi:hypothetical protein
MYSKQFAKPSDKNTKELLEREVLKCELMEEMYSKQIESLMKQIIHLETQLHIKNMQLNSQGQHVVQYSVQQPVQQPVQQQASVQVGFQQPSVQMLTDNAPKPRKGSMKPPQTKKPDQKQEQKPKINWPVIDDIPDDPEMKKSAKSSDESSAPNQEQSEVYHDEDSDHEEMYYTRN